MRGPICFLAGLLPGERPAAHRGNCRRCQEDATRAAALQAGLAGLAGDLVAAPDELRSTVLASLGEQDAADPRRDLAARVAARYVAVAGLALATLVALAAGLARRHSRALG
jgi:hypothetical protein